MMTAQAEVGMGWDERPGSI